MSRRALETTIKKRNFITLTTYVYKYLLQTITKLGGFDTLRTNYGTDVGPDNIKVLACKAVAVRELDRDVINIVVSRNGNSLVEDFFIV